MIQVQICLSAHHHLMECHQGMCWGGEPELPGLLHASVLIQQVQAPAAGVALAGEKGLPLSDDEGESGDPLEALVGRRADEVDVALL